jgi:hypothetical protein
MWREHACAVSSSHGLSALIIRTQTGEDAVILSRTSHTSALRVSYSRSPYNQGTGYGKQGGGGAVKMRGRLHVEKLRQITADYPQTCAQAQSRMSP